MKCSRCGYEGPIQQTSCPQCSAFVAITPPASFGKRHPALLISLFLAIFVSLAGTVGLAVYRLGKARAADEGQSKAQPGQQEEASDEQDGVPVEHGNPVRRQDLRAHGKLYFVPVGKQAIPVQSLADYYTEKFGVEVTVLSPVEVPAAAWIPARRQCAAEELEGAMTSAYSEIARNPDSVMIALTDEDIFPREFNWDFTYSLHSSRIGIVSTRRMDPAFWGDPANEEVRLARTKQMLTKYVAMQYFHLPDNSDPTSVLQTPLTPDGGPDDIYESDVHPEESVNGLTSDASPCLHFTYSYVTHRMSLDSPLLSSCNYSNPAHAGEETFETDLGSGHLTQRTLDLDLDSTPKIEYRRAYSAGYREPVDFGLGWGVNHSYNAWLSSDGMRSLSFIVINREDASGIFFSRQDKGLGFNPNAIYESHADEAYGARLTYQGPQYKVQYRDGTSSTYLTCPRGIPRCYWIGYQDAQGRTLRFDRQVNQELREVAAADNQGISFTYDDSHRLLTAKASNGKHVSYAYDAAGCLTRVQRTDGQVALYEYDSVHRLTSFSVVRRRGARPKNVLSNQYDAKGRLVRQVIAGVGVFKMEYTETNQNEGGRETRLTSPVGKVLTISANEDEEYVVRAAEIRFPKADH